MNNFEKVLKYIVVWILAIITAIVWLFWYFKVIIERDNSASEENI